MLADALVALASLAGNTVVAAASTDAWEAARRKFAHLLGRGDHDRTKLVQRRLDETRQQLEGVAYQELEQARANLEKAWQVRLTDLLEEDPGIEADLRALVEEIQASLPAVVVSAADHSVAAGGDVKITAQDSGVAAGVIHGNVTRSTPFWPGAGEKQAGAGFTANIGSGSAVASYGGTAIGHVEYHRAPVRGRPVRLAPQPPPLAGREELLAELDARLLAGDTPGPRMVALYGLGGTGKTSAAVEYAHRHLAEVEVAWQFAAEDPAVMTAGFGELAAQLGARDLLDARDPVASVHGVLAAYPRQWMLLFDNAPDRASVQGFLPPGGSGRVLITSQNPNWPPGQGLNVPVLGTEVACGFLVNRTGDPDSQAAQELAAELGGLPLALEQAAAYIRASGNSLAGYLALFRQRRADLLARGEPSGYSKTVATTWSLAFERLEQSAPSAVGLLRLLACCAPEAIPLSVLLQHRPGLSEELGTEAAEVLVPLLEDELAVRDAIAALRRYSLITPAGDGLVSVHRLVQAVTIDQMPAASAREWRDAAAAVIEAAIPGDPAQPETWSGFAALLPHAQAALTDDSDGISRMAAYVGHSGNYPAARDLWQRVLDMRLLVRGPEHPDTLFARASLAYWTGEAGDVTAAQDQYAALLPVHERVLGPEHPHTLTTRHQHAHWAGRAGNVTAARDQYAALLPIRERVLGPEHPDTLATRHSLAHWTGRAGDAAAARDLFAALLPIRERVLGLEHPHTLTTRHEHARWTGEAGDAAAARDLFATLLPVNQRVLGLEHPHALATRHNLARWTGAAGNAAAARDQYAALLPIRERVLGPKHEVTLATRDNLAYWTEKAEGDAKV